MDDYALFIFLPFLCDKMSLKMMKNNWIKFSVNIIITRDYIADFFSINLRTLLKIGDFMLRKNNVNICISNMLMIAKVKFESKGLLFLADCRICILIFIQT